MERISSVYQQYESLKEKYFDVLLLFCCGDFYEAYEDDAETVSKLFGLMLTKSTSSINKKGEPLRMAGFPRRVIDEYLTKLIRSGYRVALCNDPMEAKMSNKKH